MSKHQASAVIVLWVALGLVVSGSIVTTATLRGSSYAADTASLKGSPYIAGMATLTGSPFAARSQAQSASLDSQQALLKRYCISCHNDRLKTAGLALDTLDLRSVGQSAATWEKVVRKLRAGVMPPSGRPRPDEATHDAFVTWLEGELDRASAASPNPGRTETFHRLNRAEYHNAVRDLLALDVNIADLLPADDSSYGFDNIAGVLRISPALMERYLSAAKTISRLAVGAPLPAVDHEVYRVAPDAQQHDRVDGLPFGTRGGLLARHLFPLDGEYDIKIEVSGANAIREPQQLEVTVDGEQVRLFTLAGRAGAGSSVYDSEDKLVARVALPAGPRDVGVAFVKQPAVLVEQAREPFQNPRVSGNDGGPGGPMPGVTSLTIIGPYDPKGAGSTPSRKRIFVCQPANAAQEAGCAQRILSTLARRAFRGTVPDDALADLMKFYGEGRAEGGSFDAGIELAIRRLLVSPEFLFRIETDPDGPAAPVRRVATASDNTPARGAIYRVPDLALASRLSFFLWSSIPDDELLDLASRGRLRDPAVLEQQVRRMLLDRRAESLTTNFAGQWLQLRNMATVRPGDPYSLTFDETLRQAMWRETELFFESILRENRSVVDMLTADHTFLNERLAIHYGVPGIQGSHFRRVTLPADSPRRGILGHGSILTMTSHAIRTSPVFRGKWVLMNVLGTPPPEPPPNVPALVDKKTQAKVQTMRERMAQHRANPSCSTCHSLIDPAGFALENFDAIGRWRVVDESFNPIDASGALPDGTKFNGVQDLRAALVRRPERFVTTVTEKLLTYALGRGLEYYDMPAVRKIVKDASRDGYRFQAIIRGVATSYPFTMRRMVTPAPPAATAAQP
jgi:mono/diheme cytochrome c family protein